MKRVALALTCSVAMSGAASAGVIANIKLSREVPDMVAEAAWDPPVIDTGSASAPSATPKAVLWESSVTLTQRAGKPTAPFDVDGALPAHVPAGALFTGWRLADGSKVYCTQSAEAPGAPGKAALSVCMTRDGTATVRKNGKRYAEAVTGTLAAPPAFQPGIADANNVKTRPWAGPVLFFSYKQAGEKAALLLEPTNHGSIMAVGQLRVGHRIVLGAIKGNAVTLEHRSFALDDYTNPLSTRKDSGHKEAEATVDLAGGVQQTVTLGGGSFRVSRTAEGMVAVEALSAIPQDWAIDPATGRLLLKGYPYVLGAQEI
ncbi:hypothetical protein [Sphingomonas cavernae]|uniref:Uncharacterized protein n=1 Tax=Sphingomonas cavernae TaxID=2320861 RepID=A0A418WRS1_9SPHN|nr:hypothetical protein [Sphingomonas cavernae]RJF93958.1 hypothetical protein D3876_06720 [Sphingomonas cavernae]